MQICREADGYQPHLVSPEKGIKRLVTEAMKLTSQHVHRFVDEIHLVLMETVKEAARNIMTMEASGGKAHTSQSPEYLRLKGFENAVIMAASQALEEWRSEAHHVAEMMVQMECDYVTPSFFRELERQWQEEAAAAAMGQNGDGHMIESPRMQSPQTETSQSRGGGDDDSDEDSGYDQKMSPRESNGMVANREQIEQISRSSEVKAGWLEKRAGDSSSLSSLPVESWRWQKRWFVLAMETGILLYYPSPDDVNKKQPKVAVNLRECFVEDYQPDEGNSGKKSQRSDHNLSSVSLLIRIMHKDPHQKVAKQHQAVILRAADPSEKYDWLARLRHASEPAGGAPQPQKAPTKPNLQPTPTSRGLMSRQSVPEEKEKGLFGRTVDKVSNKFSKLTGLGGSKLGDVIVVGSIEDLDAYYEKLGNFCGIYARMTYDRMAKTVPKAIILCQVIRSRDRLLDQLFHYLSTRTEKEIEFMLQEDPSVERRRAAASQARKDLSEALEEIRKVTDVRNSRESRADSESVSVRALLLAGAFPLVPKNFVPAGTNPGLLYGEFTPISLASGAPAKDQLGAPVEKKEEEDKGTHQQGTAKEPQSPSRKEDTAKAAVKPRRQPPPPPPS